MTGEAKAKDALIRAAIAARKQAHCPYSRYPVGAAVMAASGEIFAGCNIENASYGLSVCAERVAIFNAMSRGTSSLKAVCVAARLSSPCGACRQVIAEFASANVPLYLVDLDPFGAHRRVRETTIGKLLPIPFDPRQAGLLVGR